MKRRSQNKKLSLSKETIRNLMTSQLRFVAGRGSDCVEGKETRGDFTACDCSGMMSPWVTFTCTDTCGDCSTTQY
ncbi:MAG TPA: class I lanthipeptide [Thermoanaerobaculia bacterium]